MSDTELIRKTLTLAKKGRGKVSPNPMVGAVVVKGGRVVASGYHQYFGGEHAEVVALNSLPKKAARGATLYVNLEPCCHHGKQPPCTERILDHGIKRVVVGTEDPNPLVKGSGLRLLQKHGVETKAGVLEHDCLNLNEGYFKFIRTGLPWITIKIAQTLDGRIATSTGDSKWITSQQSRRLVHKLRSQHDAVLVGIGTISADDPSLTVRMIRGRSPKRIVLDSDLQISLKARILNDAFAQHTMIFTKPKSSSDKIARIRELGAKVCSVRSNASGFLSLRSVLKRVSTEGVTSVLIEGGSRVFSEALRQRLADRLLVFVAPKIIGGGLSAIDNLNLKTLEHSIRLDAFKSRRVGPDVLFSGKIVSFAK